MSEHPSLVQVRWLVVYGALAMLALLAALGTVAWLLIVRFDSIELQQTAARAAQARHALEADLDELAASTRAYAQLSAVQRFVVEGDRRLLDSELSFNTLTSKEVDLVALVRTNGNVLYSAQLDPARRVVRDSLSPEILSQIRRLAPSAAELRQHRSERRLLDDRGQLVGFSFVEVPRSNEPVENGALLFFGRILEADEITRIRDASELPAVLHGPAEVAKLLAEYEANDDHTTAKVQDAQRLTGYVRLVDWQDRTMGVISFDAERELGSGIRRATVWIIGAFTGSLLLLTGLLVVLSRRFNLHWRRLVAFEQRHRKIIEQRHRKILAGLDDMVALVDASDDRILETNHAWRSLLGHAPEGLSSLALEDVFVDLSVAELYTLANDNRSRECRLHTRDDRLIDAEIRVSKLDEYGQELICIAARDISRRRHTEQQLRENQSRLAHISEHDALTGLPNRRYLSSRLPQLLSRVDAEKRGLALLSIDIDHFKNINDSSSHGWGDQLLKIIARRLQSHVAAEDIVLHLGADEFLVIALLPADSNVANTALAKAEKLLATFRRPLVHDMKTISLTASIGISVYPTDGRDGESLLKHADIALHQAKERGRDCCRAFSSEMNTRILEHVTLEQALRRAIDTEQIFVEYQPIVDLQTGLLVSFEALARWQHPEEGRISPARFIPAAEKMGLLIPLGQQIVQTAIMQLREWHDRGLVLAPISINVAPVQFERSDFVAFVHDTAHHFGIDPRLLSFEVTESALLQDSDRCIVAIDQLRSAGSRVYIDDFGTGFSNLSYLKTLPVDAVKIDQSFVRAIETDANDAAIVASVVSVSRQLRLDTVAEGIETAAQAARVRDLGCRYGQGYFFSRPLPAAHCGMLLEQLGAVRQLTDTVKQRAFNKAAGG